MDYYSTLYLEAAGSFTVLILYTKWHVVVSHSTIIFMFSAGRLQTITCISFQPSNTRLSAVYKPFILPILPALVYRKVISSFKDTTNLKPRHLAQLTFKNKLYDFSNICRNKLVQKLSTLVSVTTI